MTAKRTADGYGSNWLCDNVFAGMTIEVLPPAGLFVPGSLDDDLLLFAAGSGVTPVMAILKSALAKGNGQVVLIYANRDERSVIFAAELRELAAEHPAGFGSSTGWKACRGCRIEPSSKSSLVRLPATRPSSAGRDRSWT